MKIIKSQSDTRSPAVAKWLAMVFAFRIYDNPSFDIFWSYERKSIITDWEDEGKLLLEPSNAHTQLIFHRPNHTLTSKLGLIASS